MRARDDVMEATHTPAPGFVYCSIYAHMADHPFYERGILQARDDVIKATHPRNLDEAVQFAAMQCQVQLGDHNPQTHVPGSLEYAHLSFLLCSLFFLLMISVGL